MLEHWVSIAQPWLQEYGYSALFGVMFLEGLGIPAPGLTFLVVAELYANQINLFPSALIAYSIVGMAMGCQLGYWLGRTARQGLTSRGTFLNQPVVSRLLTLLHRRGARLLLVAPFIDGSRQYIAFLAGTAALTWGRFTSYNLIGISLWIGTWSLAVETLGQQLDTLLTALQQHKLTILFAAILLLIFIWLAQRWLQHHL